MFKGQVLKQRFQLISPLGRGGMGEIWLAKDKNSPKKVCIKCLHKGIKYSSIFQERRALLRLEHQNSIKIINYNFNIDESIYVMEYIPGSYLRNLLKVDHCLREPKNLYNY